MEDKNDTDSCPINTQKGLETFGGDEELYKTMIDSYESITFDNCCERVYKGIKEKNWELVESGAHQLEGASRYIGALKFSEISKKLKVATRKSKVNEEDVIGIYYKFIAEAKEVKICLAKFNNLLDESKIAEIDSIFNNFVL